MVRFIFLLIRNKKMKPTLLTGIVKYIPSSIYKFLAMGWINYKFPRHLFLELNTSCNLSCWHCPRPKTNQEMKRETFDKIVKEASSYGRSSFSLHLFGEPMLCSYIYYAISTLKRNKHTVLITTNGTLLSEHSEPLLSSGVDKIFISWRSGLDVESIKKLKKICVIRVFEKDEQEARKQFEGFKFQVRRVHNYGGSIKSDIRNGKRYPCYHLWLAPAIRYNGDFTICCNDPNGELVLGNVNKKSINEIWSGKRMNSLRNKQKKGIYDSGCKTCNVWSTYPSIF